jgi:NhaA family Na+:H+ antiporter
LAAVLLRIRNRHYRSVFELETSDADGDGVPDVYVAGPESPGKSA